MKIPPEETELFTFCWKDGRADMTKLTVAYRNIANAPTAWYEGVTTQQHQNFYGPHLEDNIAMTSTI